MLYDSFGLYAPIAQSVEQLPFKQTVAGSNPAGRTKKTDASPFLCARRMRTGKGSRQRRAGGKTGGEFA